MFRFASLGLAKLRFAYECLARHASFQLRAPNSQLLALGSELPALSAGSSHTPDKTYSVTQTVHLLGVIWPATWVHSGALLGHLVTNEVAFLLSSLPLHIFLQRGPAECAKRLNK